MNSTGNDSPSWKRWLSEWRWSRIFRRPRSAVLLALGAWLFGNLVWDLAVSPGLSWTAQTMFRVVTLGSRRIRDLAYDSAGLDPTMLPQMFILLGIVALPLTATIRVWLPSKAERRRKLRRELQAKLAALPDDNARLEFQRRIRRRDRLIDTLVGLLFALLFFVSFSVVNQAVLVRRVFLANLATVAPYVDGSVEERWLGRFAATRTRAEFEVLHKELEEVARHHRLLLRDRPIW